MDSHFVLTEDLAPYVEAYVKKHGQIYLTIRLMSKKHIPVNVNKTGEWRAVTRLLTRQHKFTELKVADRFLTAMDLTQLIDLGHLRIYTRAETRSLPAPLNPSGPASHGAGNRSPGTAQEQPEPLFHRVS